MAEEKSFYDSLARYAQKNPVRFHMPGHKGRRDLFPELLALTAARDVTELPETGDLFHPQGAVLRAERDAARAFGAAATLFSAGGATLCVQAVIAFAIRRARQTGRPLLVDRSCHVSAVRALALVCEDDSLWAWFSPDDPGAADRIVTVRPSTVFVTSPDYYGRFHGEGLYGACRAVDCLIAVDHSHGTQLAFIDGGARHAGKLGADLVIDSAHKTLPALTGGAYLQIYGAAADERDQLLEEMRLFGSTSPSFLIAASLDFARAWMESNGQERLTRVRAAIRDARMRLSEAGFFLASEGESDIFRLTISTRGIKIKGTKLYRYLEDNNVVCEFADEENVVCVCTAADEEEMYGALVRCCLKYADSHGRRYKGQDKTVEARLFAPGKYPEKVLGVRDALFGKKKSVPVGQALGEICAEIYAKYPPGCAVLAPGERISEYEVALLQRVTRQVACADGPSRTADE